jgi:hypothetical protein
MLRVSGLASAWEEKEPQLPGDSTSPCPERHHNMVWQEPHKLREG